jgi:hypothetical protein
MTEDAGPVLTGSCPQTGGSDDLSPAPKMRWVSPAITVVPLRCAQGAQAGDKCDRFGSLSHGSNCGD